MARPRKRENSGLPQNLLCRKRKRKDGRMTTYYFYVQADKKEKSLGTDKYLAILEAAKLNYDRQFVTSKILFIDVSQRYATEIVPTKRTTSTRSANTQAIHNLNRFFGDPPIPLEDIKPHHIKQYLEWRKNTPTLANTEISVLNTIWNIAREWGYTDLPSPTIGVKKYPKQFRDIYVEDYILDKIYQCADQQMQDIIDLIYLIGQRPVDVCNIHRSHIYDGVLHITQKKTGKKVRFAIVGKLKEIIERRLKEQCEWLSCNQWGRKLERQSLGGYFRKIREKAMASYPELADEIAKVQIRDLRAKAATDISLQTNNEQAQKQLGHTSQKMTQHYIRKDPLLQPTDELIK